MSEIFPLPPGPDGVRYWRQGKTWYCYDPAKGEGGPLLLWIARGLLRRQACR